MKNFPAESVSDGRTIVIKTHEMCDDPKYFNDPGHQSKKAIIIIRNPYHSLVSEFNRYSTQNKTGLASPATFKSKGKILFKNN